MTFSNRKRRKFYCAETKPKPPEKAAFFEKNNSFNDVTG